MESTIFLTGFPGFIGKRLIKKILEKQNVSKIHLLVLNTMKEIAEKIVERMELPASKEKISILVGDIGSPKLGMPDEIWENIKNTVTDIFHLAAIYNLDVPESVSYHVNVEGTENMLEFARQVKNLRKFNHYSTCYVSGLYQGVFREDDLDKGQKFKNYYEITKFESEKKVRQAAKEMPVTIFRPSIVVGDSKTGETDKYDGPYISLQLFKRGLHIFRPGKGAARINLAPVDFIVDSTVFIAFHQDSVGKTYALCDPNPLTFARFMDLAAEKYPATKFFITVPPCFLKFALSLPGIAQWLKVQKNAVDYANHHVIYDCTNTTQILQGSGISCPPFDSYMETFIQYFKTHSVPTHS